MDGKIVCDFHDDKRMRRRQMQMEDGKYSVSVIVPVYNMKRYLGRCVDSILAQSYSDLQILLVDDGSTDGSALLCDQLAAREDRIRAFHISHAGPGAARNRGIREAEGDYVVFVDSDDWIGPKMLETMLDVMIRENADLVTCDLKRTPADRTADDDTPGGRTADDSMPGGRKAESGTEGSSAQDSGADGPPEVDIYTQEEFMRVFFRIGSNEWVHYPVAKLYRREFLSGDLYPEGVFIGEDVASTFKVLMKTEKIVHIRRTYYYYWENPNSATARFSNRDFDLLQVWDDVAKTCRKERKYYSYAKLNRERLNYTLLMRMALAMPYDEILTKYGDQYRKLYRDLIRSEKMLLRAPIPVSRKITIAMMCRNYRLLCAGGGLYRAGKKIADGIRKK